MKKMFGKMKMVNTLSALALLFAIVGANTRCVYIFHQPEMNDKVRQLKKH